MKSTFWEGVSHKTEYLMAYDNNTTILENSVDNVELVGFNFVLGFKIIFLLGSFGSLLVTFHIGIAFRKCTIEFSKVSEVRTHCVL